MLAEIITTYEKPHVNTISLEFYVETVLSHAAPQMVGHIVMPKFVGASDLISGVCCPEDETPYRYVIDTRTAKLIHIYEV